MENLNSPSISSLLCHEDLTGIDDYKGMEETYPVTQDDDEYVKMLLDGEINESALEMQESSNVIMENWIKDARPDAVQYILNTREKFGFKVHTAYLAITYLDAFLSRKPFESKEHWLVRLSAMACLILAAKMEESLVPAISEFPRDYNEFAKERILKMEILVLRKLNWRMQKLTPFAFTHYFESRFCQNSSITGITSRVEEVILVAMRDEKMMRHRTSTMAAAATLLIIDRGLTRETLELKINTSSLGGYLQIEDVFSLYNQMKELDVEKYKSPNSEMSLVFSPVQMQRIQLMENSSVSSSRSAKRKRLTFSEYDQSSSKREAERP